MSEVINATLFRDVKVFDSRAGRVTGPMHVLVRGQTIRAVSPAGATVPAAEGAAVIDGGGRTLIPGLIDAHWHCTLAAIPVADAMNADPGFNQLAAGKAATETVLRGFTTVRDAGGPAFGLKRAIDTGVVMGPRIFPSGACISQSGGHADFRLPPRCRAAFSGSTLTPS